jgi:hypothetical protein
MTDLESSLPRSRALRASLYRGKLSQHQVRPKVSAAAFTFALLAIITEFCISSNTLTALGITNDQPGGNPFLKFAPGTYLALLGAIVAIAGAPSSGRNVSYLLRKAPGLILFMGLMIFCLIFAAINVGTTGVGIYVDTYLSAGAIAIIMVNASERQRKTLAKLILALCLVNVLMALAEYIHQEHFIPVEVKSGGVKAVTDNEGEEFRPSALYAHPLTGAMATSFGIFLVMSSGLRYKVAAVYFSIFAIGLLGFGGRAALVVTLMVLVLWTTMSFARDFVRGRLNGRLFGTVLLCVSTLGPLGVFLVTETPVGERIAARAYYDESAEVRADQWLVLDKLTPQQAIFGTPAVDLEQIFAQVGLLGVENPLILIFLNLGIIGSPVFAFGLVVYFLYLRSAYPDSGWLLLAAIFILSSSNSIGVKGPDLFMMTACAVTMKGRGKQTSIRVRRAFNHPTILRYLRSSELATEVQAPMGDSGARLYPRLSPKVVRSFRYRT